MAGQINTICSGKLFQVLTLDEVDVRISNKELPLDIGYVRSNGLVIGWTTVMGPPEYMVTAEIAAEYVGTTDKKWEAMEFESEDEKKAYYRLMCQMYPAKKFVNIDHADCKRFRTIKKGSFG